MKYSYQDVIKSYPKNHNESWWTRLFCRPLSFPVAYLLANMGMTAWWASVISIFFAILACILLCLSAECRWLGILLSILWLIMDCVDGNIARVTKSYSAMGDFIDAQSGYTIMAFIFLANGVAAFNTTTIFKDCSYILIIVGAVSSLSNILARLLNSKYTYCELEHKIKNGYKPEFVDYDNPKNSFSKIRIWCDYNLGLVGALMPLMILSQVYNTYDLLTIAYCIYSVAGFIFASVYYAIKSK